MTQRLGRFAADAGFGLALVLLGGVMAFLVLNRSAMLEADQAWHREDRVIEELNAAFSALTSAETAVRGFVITGKPQFLDDHAAGVRDLEARISSLREMTKDEGRADIEAIVRLADRKLDILRRSIEARRSPDPSRLRELIARGPGKEYMDEVRAAVAAYRRKHEERRARWEREKDARWRQVSILLVLAGMGSLVVILIAYAVVKRELRRRIRAEEELFLNMRSGVARCRMIYEGGEPADFIYLEVNRAFSAQTGLFGVVGRKVSEIIPGIREADPVLFEVYGRVTRTGKPEKLEVFVSALKEWFDLSVYSPAPGEFIAVFDVITSRKNAELEIARLTAEKIAALEAEAKALRDRQNTARDIMANLSHELRTPLASIKGFAETLRLGAIEDAENRLGFVETIERHANRLSGLVEEMLLLSDLDNQAADPTLRFETVDLAGFIAEHAARLHPGDAKGAKLSVKVPASLKVRADAEHLTRVFHNLLENAFKYNRASGPVEVDARADGGSAVVTVRDSGRGIAEGELPLIFNRFYRCRSTKHIRGTGLGLPIVKAIVELHGGRVWVESAHGKGSSFHFTLPLAG